MWLKAFLVILIIIFFFLFQGSFLSIVSIFLNPLIIAVIWLSFIDSKWLWWFVILGGGLLDLQQGLIGVNLATFILIASLVIYLRTRIAITGRFTQFFAISLLSLAIGVICQFFLRWLGLKLITDWLVASFVSQGFFITLSQMVQGVVVNFFVLLIFYILFRRRLIV